MDAGEPGVLPVVGREDARGAALVEQGARRVASPSAVSASASITSGTGTAAITARISSADRVARAEARADRPRPCTWPSPPGRHPAHPSAGRCMRTASVGQARRGVAGRAEPDHAGARGHGATGAEHGRALHAGRAGRHADGVRPLVAVAGARRQQRRDVGVLDRAAPAGVGKPIPMSATSTAPLQRGAVALEQAGLERGEGHGARRPAPRRPAPRRCRRRRPRGCRWPARRARPAPPARRRSRGTRCRRRRRSRGRTGGKAARRASAASSDDAPGPRAGPGAAAATRPSAPLLPLPATTTTRRP